MLYPILQSVSMGVYSCAALILYVEETLIGFMLYCFLGAIKLACHPVMIMPLIGASIYAGITLLPRSGQTVYNNNRMLLGTGSNRSDADAGRYHAGDADRSRRLGRLLQTECNGEDEGPH